MLSNIQSSTRELIRNIIIAAFKELDQDFKNSTYRKSNYYIIPTSVDTPETLYVMADEKYIGAQDIEKDLMVKLSH